MNISTNLAAVISSHTVRQDIGDTSEKQEAIIAKIDQDNSFAFNKMASPGNFCLSHSANILKSSTGTQMFSSGKDTSLFFSVVSKYEEELAFLLNCMPFKTVEI